MTIHFSLRKQGKSMPVILIQIFDPRLEGRKFMFSTGMTVDLVHWDSKRKRVKSFLSNAMEYSQINERLDGFEKILIAYRAKKLLVPILTRAELRAELLKAESPHTTPTKSIPATAKMCELWKQIIDSSKNSSGEEIKKSTKSSKYQTLGLVQRFANENRGELSFETIDICFYHDFDKYMKRVGLSSNTRGKHFKEIKAIMREAMDRDYIVNTAFQKKSFKVIRTQSDSTYMSENQILDWWQLKLETNLEQRRDTFVMACYVGARFCDWHQIHPRNVSTENGKKILKIVQQKTGDTVHVPVHPVVQMVFDKYGNDLPEIISNQKFNKALKEIGRQAKMGSISIGNKSIDKCEAISTHTARRSFATNAYLSNSMDVYQVMKCTGHKTEASFLRYIKLDGKDFAIQAADSTFFTKATHWSRPTGFVQS